MTGTWCVSLCSPTAAWRRADHIVATLDAQATLESNLFHFETSYLTDSSSLTFGNIVKGYEAYVKAPPSTNVSDRRKKTGAGAGGNEISEAERVFSKSSGTYQKVRLIQSTPSQQPLTRAQHVAGTRVEAERSRVGHVRAGVRRTRRPFCEAPQTLTAIRLPAVLAFAFDPFCIAVRRLPACKATMTLRDSLSLSLSPTSHHVQYLGHLWACGLRSSHRIALTLSLGAARARKTNLAGMHYFFGLLPADENKKRQNRLMPLPHRQRALCRRYAFRPTTRSAP